jgi:N-formylglutamate amidohydrolase
MTRTDTGRDDSPHAGGSIPDLPGAAAFTLIEPATSALPVLIAVPHAGRVYPPALLSRMRRPEETTLRLEDRHADSLARAVAAETGASLLLAHAPRAMIDLNRAPDDVDWEMFVREPGAALPPMPGSRVHRARNGLGLIPRRLPGFGELWTRPHRRAELTARIEAVHAPYHQCLAAALQRLRKRWGAALLIDLHSMPSLPHHHGNAGAEFVLGDRFGTSCDGRLTAACFGIFASETRRIAHNRPYAGGYVLERHGAPKRGIHAVQIEIDRASYLDPQLDEPGEGFESLAALLGRFVARLAETTAALGHRGASDEGWAEAAE